MVKTYYVAYRFDGTYLTVDRLWSRFLSAAHFFMTIDAAAEAGLARSQKIIRVNPIHSWFVGETHYLRDTITGTTVTETPADLNSMDVPPIEELESK